MKKENVVIIGGGPAGLSAALYLARSDRSPLVIAGSPSGGQLMLTSEVENFPGHESILGADLIAKIRSQAEKFHTRFIDDNVQSVVFGRDEHTVILSSNEKITTKTLLIATGASALWLNLPSEQRLRGKGVSACATCDGFFFREKSVAVVGGGDTAMEEALTLTRFASQVYVIHRKNQFRASKIMQKRVLEHAKIKVLWSSEVVEVLGKDKVEGVKLKTQNTQNETLKVDGLFLGIGHKPDTGFLKDSGITLDDKGYIITSGVYAWRSQKEGDLKIPKEGFDFSYQYSTNKKGVFAAGDAVDFVYRQAGVASGMGIAAALEIENYLEVDPTQRSLTP